MNWYYISFATQEAFLGATVVQGFSPENAVAIATNNDLNPGGEALIMLIPDSIVDNEKVVPFKYKLLSKEECQFLGTKRLGDVDPFTRNFIENYSSVI